ncbi:MAG: STAS domain-containing protein [Chloroflexi bacterium AL-W]|nr:STAS domain-containing protein [Chloroflexi bacterium AL-N1]NOK70571.1 STAS domain-containing protein [Chloroflexi bacterium AL-N10]NOK77563.1 STAS domain-containing protein [Chloroflexi bacterium AL-N5]NOK84414.1 STAS domain-containing protein [Chloroflexi bacterium AL-W]NOK92303.1 STAS domain-containing protein [Chloroflexi bacterium AL-N15]
MNNAKHGLLKYSTNYTQVRILFAIFDITGVPVVDTQVAQTLLEITKAIRLLGAQAILVGIRPEVAQTLVGLHVSLDSMTTYADLQEAIVTLLRRAGWQTVNRV